MVKLNTAIYFLMSSLLIIYMTRPLSVEAGMMMKMKKKGGQGGGSGIMELLVAGIVTKLLSDMKGGHRSNSMQMTKYVPVPIFVQSGGHMMMDSGWPGGMMMDSGWDTGMMMNSGYKGGMMMNSGWKGGMMMNNRYRGGMMMGGD